MRLFLTDKGRCHWLEVHEIEQAARPGEPLRRSFQIPQLEPGTRPLAHHSTRASARKLRVAAGITCGTSRPRASKSMYPVVA